MKLPAEVLPLLESVATEHALPIELWKGNDRATIKDAFSSLAIGLASSELDLHALPRGYWLLSTVFDWERERLFEGWNAFEWVSEPADVLRAYEEIGLRDEACAIGRALEVWQRLAKIDSPTEEFDIDDATNAAYEHKLHPYSDHDKRFQYLVDFFCANANSIFYEPEAGL
jgi:hypothetical protein